MEKDLKEQVRSEYREEVEKYIKFERIVFHICFLYEKQSVKHLLCAR